MQKVLLILFCLAFSFAIYGQTYLTEEQSGSTINVKTSEKGSKILVNLNYGGGTGYNWKLVGNNKDVLAFVNQSTKNNSPSKDARGIPMTGGALTAIFEFSIMGNVGTSELKFVLMPPYNNTISKTVTYTVQVGDESGVQEPIILKEENKNIQLALSSKDAGTPIVVCLANFDAPGYKWVNVANNDNVVAYQSEQDHYDHEDPNYPFIRDFDFFVTGEVGSSNIKFNLQSESGKVIKTMEYTILVQ